MEEFSNFDFEKFVDLSISKIKTFESEKALKVINESKKFDYFSTLEKDHENKLFKLKIFLETPIFGIKDLKNQILEDDETLRMYAIGESYFIDYNSISTINFQFKIPQTFSLNLKKIFTGSLDNYDNKFQRLLLPIKKDLDLYNITTKSVKYDEKIVFSGLIEVNVNHKNYHVFTYIKNDPKKHFLIIDSVERECFSDFKKATESIIISLGFLTGNLITSESYYQTSEDISFNKIENIFFEKKEDSIYSNDRVIDHTKFVNYLRQINQEEKYKIWAKPMANIYFDNICTTVFKNSIFHRCCQLIIEANQTKHNLLKAGILSIALETISGLIYEDNKEKINPIQDKLIAKKLRLELLNTLNNFEEEIPEEAVKIFTSKINELNKPTNSKKLSFPFQYYKIKLSKEELNILNHRNKFLHGTSPFEEEELQLKRHEILVIIANLKFMINCLMLKYIGYKGHTTNYPAIIEYNTKDEISNPLYKII